jgi:HAD superfamily hydrolase (TIGR01549 family)
LDAASAIFTPASSGYHPKMPMISTVLFDLDNTLLSNNMETFLPKYLEALGEHMAEQVDPRRLTQALLAGTQAMIDNLDPERTLREVFNAVFFPALGWKPESAQDQIEAFYTSRFPKLQSLTSPRPEAVPLVRAVFERKWRVGIVTNPLFPKSAVDQRLQWAGLRLREFPFDLITTYETSHFAKPHPEYFGEVLARLLCNPEEALVVGDDQERDIDPAARLGLATFVVQEETVMGGDGHAVAGPLRVLWQGLSAPDNAFGQPHLPDPTALPARLCGNLAVLFDTFGRVQAWQASNLDEGWGPTEIACHLRDVEREISQPRIDLLREAHDPYLPAVESDLWAEERDYYSQDGQAALREFVRARRDTLVRLRSLPAEAWLRSGRHALFGPTTLAEQLKFVAQHDVMHVEQLGTWLTRQSEGASTQ